MGLYLGSSKAKVSLAGFDIGLEEGKTIGFANGLEEGKTIGYEEGKTDGIAEGETIGYSQYESEVEPINSELEQTLYGTDTGGKSFYDEFWDLLQNYGNRTNYTNAFKESGFEYFHPKYKVIPTSSEGGLSNVFMYCRKLKKLESEYIDFSQAPRGTYASNGMYYTFCSCSVLEEIEDIGLSPSSSYSFTFAFCSKLHTIAKITVDENTMFDNTFASCGSLVNLNIEGTIGQNKFNTQASTKLSKASHISIINALSTTTSGLTVTFSKTAVNNAFETNEGAANGSTSEEWLNLIATKSNWTISLV